MPTVKVAVGGASVELDRGETGVTPLAALAVSILEQALKAEHEANTQKAQAAGGQYV